MAANKSSLMNVFVLRVKKASLWGVYRTQFLQRKGSYCLYDVSVFLAQIFVILAFEASTFSFQACFSYQQCCSGLVTDAAVPKAVAKWLLDVGCCSPFKVCVIFAFSWRVRWVSLISLSRLYGKNEATASRLLTQHSIKTGNGGETASLALSCGNKIHLKLAN